MRCSPRGLGVALFLPTVPAPAMEICGARVEGRLNAETQVNHSYCNCKAYMLTFREERQQAYQLHSQGHTLRLAITFFFQQICSQTFDDFLYSYYDLF